MILYTQTTKQDKPAVRVKGLLINYAGEVYKECFLYNSLRVSLIYTCMHSLSICHEWVADNIFTSELYNIAELGRHVPTINPIATDMQQCGFMKRATGDLLF